MNQWVSHLRHGSITDSNTGAVLVNEAWCSYYRDFRMPIFLNKYKELLDALPVKWTHPALGKFGAYLEVGLEGPRARTGPVRLTSPRNPSASTPITPRRAPASAPASAFGIEVLPEVGTGVGIEVLPEVGTGVGVGVGTGVGVGVGTGVGVGVGMGGGRTRTIAPATAALREEQPPHMERVLVHGPPRHAPAGEEASRGDEDVEAVDAPQPQAHGSLSTVSLASSYHIEEPNANSASGTS